MDRLKQPVVLISAGIAFIVIVGAIVFVLTSGSGSRSSGLAAATFPVTTIAAANARPNTSTTAVATSTTASVSTTTVSSTTTTTKAPTNFLTYSGTQQRSIAASDPKTTCSVQGNGTVYVASIQDPNWPGDKSGLSVLTITIAGVTSESGLWKSFNSNTDKGFDAGNVDISTSPNAGGSYEAQTPYTGGPNSGSTYALKVNPGGLSGTVTASMQSTSSDLTLNLAGSWSCSKLT